MSAAFPPRSLGAPVLNTPETDSDGIHDTLVTDDSIRMAPPCSASPAEARPAHAAQSRIGATDRANDEEGISRSVVSRSFTAAGDAH